MGMIAMGALKPLKLKAAFLGLSQVDEQQSQ